MAGSTFGNIFRITTWGESHGKGIGVVVDGCPAGLELDESDIQKFLDRRKPGQSRFSTPRKEEDAVEILSGTFEGKTTGTPISMVIFNRSQRSKDYREIANYYRPGHADMTYDLKYGFRDYRGGGRSSGRETIGRVAAGAIASKILDQLGVQILTYTKSIGPVSIDPSRFDHSVISENPFYMPDREAANEAQAYLEECIRNQDSSGGVIECIVKHMKPGIGDPVFEKLDANLAKAVCSIGAVKGFEIGDGFEAARALGHANNDQYTKSPEADQSLRGHPGRDQRRKRYHPPGRHQANSLHFPGAVYRYQGWTERAGEHPGAPRPHHRSQGCGRRGIHGCLDSSGYAALRRRLPHGPAD